MDVSRKIKKPVVNFVFGTLNQFYGAIKLVSVPFNLRHDGGMM